MDGQTDRQHAIAIPCFALVHRAVKGCDVPMILCSLVVCCLLGKQAADNKTAKYQRLEKVRHNSAWLSWLPMLGCGQCSTGARMGLCESTKNSDIPHSSGTAQ